jgi:UDP-2,3-diacylglucosamine hydrolase
MHLFIADLHLDPARPATTAAFFDFLGNTAQGSASLAILGDLFEYWIGDDAMDELHRDTARRLKALADAGTPTRFMHGNRDFLVAQGFAAQAGLVLSDDPTMIELDGAPTLLMHGDTLCSDDHAYQAFRAYSRNPENQRQFLAQPIPARIAIAHNARDASAQHKQGASEDIMDVNPDTVAQVFREHGYPRLIHGHTHRPGRHVHRVDGHDCERWVLPDWYGAGGYLACESGACALKPLA